MNTNHQYPNLVTKFFTLPIREAKLITICALDYQEVYVLGTGNAGEIATWYNTLKKIEDNVASDDNPLTNLELLQTISEYEDDPSIALKHIGFDEEESQ
jgi:hypothetical protein